jgi:cytolysin-activating lysine-acyltransferase
MTRSTKPSIDIIAPALDQQAFVEAEVFGAAVWLWMQSDAHRDIPLQVLNSVLMPAIGYRQFILGSIEGWPVFYLSWAMFDEDAEHRYLHSHPSSLAESDWHSGDRMWIVDWIAPFGHTQQVTRLLRQHWFKDRCFRFLYHRGDERGMRIQCLSGNALSKQTVSHWLDLHPLKQE